MIHVHFTGIGGSGMMPLAKLAALYGYRVSGTDKNLSEAKAEELRKLGIKIFEKPSAENLPETGYLVYSTAIRNDHPEKAEALKRAAGTVPAENASSQEKSFRLLHRMDFLNILTENFPVRFGIAGTHGKTSTSSMTGWLLQQCGYDPLIAVGGSPLYLKHQEGGGVRKGEGLAAVFETDESDGSFLRSHANYRIILNADADHLDYYGDFSNLKEAFAQFADAGKVTVLNGDDPFLSGLITRRGSSEKIMYNTENGSSVFFPSDGDTLQLEGYNLTMQTPGRHFAHNAAAAILCVREAVLRGDLPLPAGFTGNISDTGKLTGHMVKIMQEFPGVERRIEKIAEINGTEVYDDYGHHPTEITAVIRALKGRIKSGGRLFVVFQPHRYTRTRDLAREFAWSLEEAHHVFLLPVYSAGEDPLTGVSEKSIAGGFTLNGKCTLVQDDSPESLASLISKLNPDDVIVYQGAGDISAKIRSALKRDSI